jgi:hypothetical protein
LRLRGLLVPTVGLAVWLTSCRSPGSEAFVHGRAQGTPGRTRSNNDRVDARCAWPSPPRTILEDGRAVLLEWQFPDAAVYSQSALPADSAYLAFRSEVQADSADLRRPVADAPRPKDSVEAAIWQDEEINNELAQSGQVGTIEGITCLDALLFAFENARTPELTHPTEFLASVLRREVEGRLQLAVGFGAGDEMFPPKSVYGSDVVAKHVTQGWEYWYAIHNHTLQRNGDRVALGNPTLSTSDVELVRNLAAEQGLRSARVTNGFYTFSASAQEFSRMRSR